MGELGNVLITSVSKKVPLLEAVKHASNKIDSSIKIYGGDIDKTCIGSYFVDSFWEMPRIVELTIEQLIEYCKKKHINAIVPTRDGELRFFSKWLKKLREHGISVMVSNEKEIDICLDKLLFSKYVKDLGYPAIPSEKEIRNIADKKVVVKEQFGAGSEKIGVGLSKEDAVVKSKTLQFPIFQPFIYGYEVSVDLYIDLRGKTKGVIVRKREKVVNGESQVTTTVYNHELEKMCSALGEEIGLYGHVVMQILIDEDHKPHIIECNSRFGGASTLSVAAGLDSFYYFLLEANGKDISDIPFKRNENNLKLVRYPKDVIL